MAHLTTTTVVLDRPIHLIILTRPSSYTTRIIHIIFKKGSTLALRAISSLSEMDSVWTDYPWRNLSIRIRKFKFIKSVTILSVKRFVSKILTCQIRSSNNLEAHLLFMLVHPWHGRILNRKKTQANLGLQTIR